MMSGLMDDDAEIEAEVRRGGHLGLKPYWSYVTHKAQADVTLEDMIPPGQRRVADRLGLILMVHIPRLGRLADPVNIAGLQRLCEECPDAKIIMAHFGRSYFPEAIGDFHSLLRYENLLVDFAMVQDWEVCETLINSFGPRRILFGLDMPVAQEKGKLISANGQRHFFTKRVRPWSIHNSAGSYRMTCTFYAYEIIRAFKKASDRTGLSREEIEAVFLTNALGVVGEVRANLGLA
jgi:predicted TIM-barrel fold metal-dependent hydrolase